MDLPFTLNFDEIDASDLPRVGGKAANLGEMTRAGFPIPPGFCVTVRGFQEFIAAAPAMENHYRALAALKPDDLEGTRQIGQEIRSYLSSIPMPVSVSDAVLAAWQSHGKADFYAVRSSATAEDLPTASFAGQQETFLNVRGEQHLLESVRACWVSLFTDRAILYRAQNGFDHRQVLLSVVIQKMVIPEISGIMFTADPVSGHRQILSIDASYGLGEALVAGLVSADLYKVDRRSWQVIESKVGDKQLAIRPDPDGGTYQEDLDEALQKSQVLTENQAVALAKIGMQIESHYRSPQDIEWVFADGKFHIVQSRPITSLFPLPENDGEFRIYFSFSHVQVMTDVMSPMGISIWKLLFPFGRPDHLKAYNKHIHGVGGRIYAEISPMLNTRAGRKLIPRLLTVADELSKNALTEFVQREEFLERAENAMEKATLRGILHWVGPILPHALHRLWIAKPETAVPYLDRHIQEAIENAKAEIFAAPAGLPRLKTAFDFTSQAFVENAKNLIPFVATIMIAKTLLEKLVHEVASPKDLTAVYSGLEGNVTTNMDLEVGDLADIARQHPEIVALLQKTDVDSQRAQLTMVAGGPEFLSVLDKFLKKYGMRGPSEIDIGRPRWRDNPGSLLQMVLGSVGHAQAGVHRAYHNRLVAEGWKASERLEAAVRSTQLGFIKAPLVRRMATVFRTHMPIREHPKFMLIQMFDLIRNVLLENGAALVAEGRLQKLEDIWLLEFHEVIQALENPEVDLISLAAARRRLQTHYQDLVPPRLFTSDGEQIKAQYKLENLPAGAVPGSSVSGGVVEGTARVVTDPTREVLNPGEILVAPFTDPGWTPLFINAAGLVMEVGGLMTHGSVIAREYGIPAVVGVPDATRRFKTGDRLRVNGDVGYIEWLGDGDATRETE